MIDNGYIPLAEKFWVVLEVEDINRLLSPTVADATATKVGGTQTFSNNLEMSLPLIPKAKYVQYYLLTGEQFQIILQIIC